MTPFEKPPPEAFSWHEEIRNLRTMAVACIPPGGEFFSVASKTFLDHFKITETELRKRTLADLLVPGTSSRTTGNDDCLFQRADGQAFRGAFFGAPLLDSSGTPIADAIVLSVMEAGDGDSAASLPHPFQKVLFSALSALPELQQGEDLLRTICQIIAEPEAIDQVAIIDNRLPRPWDHPLFVSGKSPVVLPGNPSEGERPPQTALFFGEPDRSGFRELFLCLTFSLSRTPAPDLSLAIATRNPILLRREIRHLLGALSDLVVMAMKSLDEQHKRAETEHRLAIKNALLESLRHLNAIASARPAETELFRESCRVFLSLPEVVSVLLWELDPDTGCIRPGLVETAGNEIDSALFDGMVLSSSDPVHRSFPIISDTLLEGRVGVSNNLPAFLKTAGADDLVEVVIRARIHSAITVPVFRKGQVSHILNVNIGIGDYFDDELVRLSREAGEILSSALAALDSDRDRRAAQFRMQKVEASFRQIFERSPDPAWIMRDNRFIEANEAAARLFGYSSRAEFFMLHPGEVSPAFQPDGESSKVKADRMMRIAREKGLHRFEWVHQRQDGSTFWTEVTLSASALFIEPDGIETPAPEGTPTDLYAILRDIARQKELENHLHQMALHDSLTGLPNRLALESHLPMTISRSKKEQSSFAVALVDLDNLKSINDSLGHLYGDRFLKEFSRRIASCLREGDFFSRIGGDEFVILIKDLSGDDFNQTMLPVLSRFEKVLEPPFEIAPHRSARIEMSMGVALYPEDGTEGDGLLRQADIAMYQIKRQKNSRSQWWLRTVPANGVPPRVMEPVLSGPFPAPGREDLTDGYGQRARLALKRNQDRMKEVIDLFSIAFYEHLAKNPEPRAILSTLDDREMERLIRHQTDHLSFLLDPETTPPMLKQKAKYLGRIHTMVGVNGALLTQAMALYRRLLFDFLNQSRLSSRDRFEISLITELRLQDDIQTELSSSTALIGEYFDLLSRNLPLPGELWTDLREREMEPLGKLQGIQGFLLLRP